MVALTGRREAYYTDYRGRPNEFIGAAKYGFLYQGQRYLWQKKPRGTPALDLPAESFVVFLQNHDQIANSMAGLRLHALTSPARCRAMTAFLLLMPGIPMLFQGQEFAASNPFLYFADHKVELDRAVRKGRREFLGQFPSMASAEAGDRLADPGDVDTFRRSVLDPAERQTHAAALALHRDLFALRRDDPVLARRPANIDGALLGAHAWLLRFFCRGCRPLTARQSWRGTDVAAGARAPTRAARGTGLANSMVERSPGIRRCRYAAALSRRISSHSRGERAGTDAGNSRSAGVAAPTGSMIAPFH
jgi:maltooligosyltrehalose trehalohydrolase